MSIQSPNSERSTDPFTATESIEYVDETVLANCPKPDALVETGTPVYAVAYRTGVLTFEDMGHEAETTAVLYLSADGKRAFERYFRRGVGTAPRACIVDPDLLSPAGAVDACAARLSLHPEVEA